MARYSTEGRICDTLIATGSWFADPYRVSGMVATLALSFPNLPIVADGRPCADHRRDGVTDPTDPRAVACDACYTRAGRGTTGGDLFGMVEIVPGIVEPSQIAVKTGLLKGKSKPSQVDLSTGSGSIPAILDGVINHGAPFHLLIWAGKSSKSETGHAVMFDAAPFIRAHDGPIPVSPPGGFKANGLPTPTVYVKSQPRPTGLPGGTAKMNAAIRAFEDHGTPLPAGKWYTRREGQPISEREIEKYGEVTDLDGNPIDTWQFPCVQGWMNVDGQRIPLRKWTAPYRCRYASLHLSLFQCGIRQEDWASLDMTDLPDLVASYDW